MELNHYFSPFDISLDQVENASMGLTHYTSSIDCREFDIAILWVPEYRYTDAENRAGHTALESVIERFNQLHVHGYAPKILLLGSFNLGSSVADTEAGLAEVIDFLIQCKVMPIVLGGSRSLTYAAYKAFERQEQIVNVTAIDNYLNLDEGAREPYLGRIVKEQPNFLFNYSCIGYQTYYVSPAELELAEELYFDVYRLGEVRGEIYSVEPIIRSAEIASVSLDVIKQADFSSALEPQPNGLYAEEICQAMRYIGLSEKMKVTIISELGALANASDERLLAQMLWCVVDGHYSRKAELPGGKKEGFLKYRVPLRNDEFQLIFYKSLSTDRWWMEIPVPPQYANKYRKHHLVPCSYEDYQIATKDDLPERWWKAYKKML
jgi:formiminoglutamase